MPLGRHQPSWWSRFPSMVVILTCQPQICPGVSCQHGCRGCWQLGMVRRLDTRGKSTPCTPPLMPLGRRQPNRWSWFLSTVVISTCCWPRTCPDVSHRCWESYEQVPMVIGNSGWLINWTLEVSLPLIPLCWYLLGGVNQTDGLGLIFLTCCQPWTCPWVSHWCRESYGQVTMVIGNSGWLNCIRSGDTQDIIHVNILNLGTPQGAGGIPEGLNLLGRLLSLVHAHTRTLRWGKLEHCQQFWYWVVREQHQGEDLGSSQVSPERMAVW